MGNRQLDEGVVKEIGAIFDQTCGLLLDLFEDEALFAVRQRAGEMKLVRQRSVLVYDTLMAAFCDYIGHSALLREHASEIRQDVQSLYIKEKSTFDGRKTDRADFLKRVSMVQKIIRGYVDESNAGR
ncbi:hypothetical protein JKI95_08535 [Corynebacterium aquatimens]|uniref:hypothetical protein n=1 Tax=Corynebacterium aquatimens TaxID=1190508 RepID=UPI00254084DC|nr:hypothetical protein [Corynebacterium aquatimens]QYH19240.1 hypothetical protein JKI95_08535 [Corynebacterium aquatimens]